MKIYELFNDDLEEGRLAKWAAMLGLSAAAGAGLGTYTQPSEQPIPTVSSQSQTQQPPAPQAPQPSPPEKQSKPVTQIIKPVTQIVKPAQPVNRGANTASNANPTMEKFLMDYAIRSGLRGNELAAFLAQCAHESLGFKRLEEFGSDEYLKNLYDIEGDNPKKARLLGNISIGDGVKYKGRGFIHLTGRENYEKFGLKDKPEDAATPDNAAKIAIWFWKEKVRPNVSNWNNVRSVTYKINPSMKGIDDRTANYLHYKKLLMPPKKKAQPIQKRAAPTKKP